MPRLRRTIRPMVRTATVAWLWQHRHHLVGAIRFLRSLPQRLRGGQRADVVTEARLRARLATDRRTRDADVLATVRDGVALVAAGKPASAAAAEIARSARGVREVDLTAAPVVAPPPVATSASTPTPSVSPDAAVAKLAP